MNTPLHEFEAFPKVPRWSREIVITEKLDGSNAQVTIAPLTPFQNLRSELPLHALAKIETADGPMVVYAGSRNRWLTLGKSNDNFGFAAWVASHAEDLVINLGPGRHFGEWYGLGIQRGYNLHERRFALFNVHKWGVASVRPKCCDVVPTLYTGLPYQSAISGSLQQLAEFGSKAAPGYMNPEGIMIYHVAARQVFKKTIEGDEVPKSGHPNSLAYAAEVL